MRLASNTIYAVLVFPKALPSFLREGYFSGLRGRLQAREIPTGSEKYWFVSGGTITAAMVLAKEMDPNNRYVKMVERDGLPEVQILAERTPDDVCVYRTGDGQFKQMLFDRPGFGLLGVWIGVYLDSLVICLDMCLLRSLGP